MREFKFRAWDKSTREMFVEDDRHTPADLVMITNAFPRAVELMQFTGLKDKNGKEIYEGDIVNGRGDVRWDNIRAAFYVRYPENDIHFPSGPKPERFEVIGNIYENPELLK